MRGAGGREGADAANDRGLRRRAEAPECSALLRLEEPHELGTSALSFD